jgi:hypothetical protein
VAFVSMPKDASTEQRIAENVQLLSDAGVPAQVIQVTTTLRCRLVAAVMCAAWLQLVLRPRRRLLTLEAARTSCLLACMDHVLASSSTLPPFAGAGGTGVRAVGVPSLLLRPDPRNLGSAVGEDCGGAEADWGAG